MAQLSRFIPVIVVPYLLDTFDSQMFFPQSIFKIFEKMEEVVLEWRKKVEYLVIFALILVILDEVINSIRRK